MATIDKRFSKLKWLESANAQKSAGYLSQREIDDACSGWVDAIDGKTKSEIEQEYNLKLNDNLFV